MGDTDGTFCHTETETSPLCSSSVGLATLLLVAGAQSVARHPLYGGIMRFDPEKAEHYHVPYTDLGQAYDFLVSLHPDWFKQKPERSVVEPAKNGQLQLPV